MTDGLYVLANDAVYDQLVAILNSIEVNVGEDCPVCVIPYDDRVDRVREETQRRQNLSLFDDAEAMAKWDNFVNQSWQTRSNAISYWEGQGETGVYRKGFYRCLYSFDGPFDRFVYLDADVLVMNSLDIMFNKLNQTDFVVYDFQYKHPNHVYDLNSPKLYEVFPKERIDQEVFCTGLFASKKGLFDAERCQWLLEQLKSGEGEILYPQCADQPLLNYMVMKLGISSCNLTFEVSDQERTGNCVTSPHFEERDGVLYDQGKRLTYLHYIGISSKLIRQVCAGQNLEFPYRDLFLHYRFLHEPDQRPSFTGKPKPYSQSPGMMKKIFKKLGLQGS
ncbi:MAG: Npun_R2821/Npun_R2822 family protein [Microcoleaceae cyanobacterium]